MSCVLCNENNTAQLTNSISSNFPFRQLGSFPIEQEDEISGFKETIRLDVRHMRQQIRQTELAPEHINDTNDRCCRGIEHFATRDSLMRQETAKTALIESVLREQAHLSATMPSVDTCDGDSSKPSTVRTDAIAQAVCDVSTRMSLEARSRAATFGASDRAFIAAEEAGLRALLASHNLASPTAQTVMYHAPTRGYARSASSIQPTITAGTVERSLPSSCLKRSACSVPNMMNYASPGPSTSSAMFQAYEQVATHRRRRLSLLRESLLASMNISDSNITQDLQNHHHQQQKKQKTSTMSGRRYLAFCT